MSQIARQSGPVSRPGYCSIPVGIGRGVIVVSRLSFQIDEEAALVGVKRSSPWASLRTKLFGAGAEKWRDLAVVSPLSDTQNEAFLVRRAFALRQPSAASAAPRTGTRPSPARPASATIPVRRAAAPYQVEYKDCLICASQLEDDSWIATYFSQNDDPRHDLSGQQTHRFLSRIMAIASAQIEIDELEKAAASPE
jgi:hypothetical protein